MCDFPFACQARTRDVVVRLNRPILARIREGGARKLARHRSSLPAYLSRTPNGSAKVKLLAAAAAAAVLRRGIPMGAAIDSSRQPRERGSDGARGGRQVTGASTSMSQS